MKIDKKKALKALVFLDTQNCLKGEDKVWFERLIEDETLTLYIDITDLHIVSVYDDEDFEYSFNVTVTDIFEVVLRDIGIGLEYA